MQVQIKEGQIRNTPSFLGRILAKVEYGAAVDVLESRKGWRRIATAAGVKGWLHESALTSSKIVLTPDAEDVQQAAEDSEIALAGRGFTAQVEKEYRARHRHLDYKRVEQMETFRVSPAAVSDFLRQGELSLTGGER